MTGEFRAEVADIIAGMARGFDDLRRQAHGGQRDHHPLLHDRLDAFGGCAGRAEDAGRRPQGFQGRDAVDMIVMVMGDENGGEREPLLLQMGDDGFCLAGVDDDDFTGAGQGADAPDIIVGTNRNGGDAGGLCRRMGRQGKIRGHSARLRNEGRGDS